VAVIHSAEVVQNTEHDIIVVDRLVSLRTLKALNRVMECRIGRVNIEGGVWLDNGSLPASIPETVVHLEHVVGAEATEGVHVFGTRLFLALLSAFDCHVGCHKAA